MVLLGGVVRSFLIVAFVVVRLRSEDLWCTYLPSLEDRWFHCRFPLR